MTKRLTDFVLRLQPGDGGALHQLGESAAEADWQSLVVTVAYATQAGVAQFVGEISATWKSFETASKVFVVGLDFGLTEPMAIRTLAALPNAACHLHDARGVLACRLRPQTRFHPKLYAFGSHNSFIRSRLAAGIVGSANLTAAGLTSNLETYSRFLVSARNNVGRRWVRQLAAAEAAARSQPIASEKLLLAYETLRPKLPAGEFLRKEPSPGGYRPSLELQPTHLRILRAARCLWTQTLKIVENRGQGNPGNQVDLKRGARAFFRSTVPLGAPVNTSLGSIETVSAAGRLICNLRYGDNGMDKVNLPIPGGLNPPSYDHSYVLWERNADGSFLMHVRKTAPGWIKESSEEGTLFKYAGGQRIWGVFNAAP